MNNFKEKNDKNMENKNQYIEKLKKHNVDIIANIKMSFDSTLEYVQKLSQNMDDVSSYKMFILSVNNALELLFKFMVFNRNEFLLYSSEQKEKVYKKYKQAKENGYSQLSFFFADNPSENDLHTISFTEACKILSYIYQIEEFDELFYERCMELAKVRNSLIHYSGFIRKVDIISFYEMFSTSIEWFNQDIKKYYSNSSLSIILGEKKLEDYLYVVNHDQLWSDVYEIKVNIIEQEILEDDICKQILGFIIDNSSKELIGIDSKDYIRIEELFFKEAKKKKKEIGSYFYQRYHMMLLADMIFNRGITAFPHEHAPEVMHRLDISDFTYTTIMTKWKLNDEEIKKQLNISSNIHALYEANYYDDEEYDYEEYDEDENI